MTDTNHTPLWEIIPLHPPEDAQSVAVWRFHLDVDDTCHALLTRLLTPRERERADRLKILHKRRRWIVSRVALRLFTARAIGVRLNDLHYSHGPLGKPGLDTNHHQQGLCFNNTDSGDLGLIALAWNREVGIDLERLPRQSRAERITRRRFAVEEQAPILDVADPERNRRFLQCWTRKEAWGKAIGVGIRYPMREFVLCDNLPEEERMIRHQQKDWQLTQLYPDAQSIACLVTEGRDCQLQTRVFDNDFARLIDETH